MLDSPEVVDAAPMGAHGVELEALLCAPACTAAAWSAQLEKKRVAREKYYTSVRRDVERPPGHSGRWRLPRVQPS